VSDINRIKLIVDLTTARVEILKLRADDYTWQCHIDEQTRNQLMQTLGEIDGQLAELRAKP
jgi:hypothetical protein